MPDTPTPIKATPGEKHYSPNVRICHWINTIAVGYLIVSGIHIFLDFPELYWGKVGFRGHPALFRLEDLGITWDEAGAMGDRRWGRNYHFTFAWVFTINGVIYVLWNLYRKHFRNRMLPSRGSLSATNLKADFLNHLPFRARSNDQRGRYGTFQRLSYLGMIFVVTPVLFVTGLAQMPAFTAIAPWMIDMLGGRQTARTLHTITTLIVVLFIVVHVVEVFLAGLVNEVRAMITGKLHTPAGEAHD
jgi:thiosulfate reductase cytochrome b subunit